MKIFNFYFKYFIIAYLLVLLTPSCPASTFYVQCDIEDHASKKVYHANYSYTLIVTAEHKTDNIAVKFRKLKVTPMKYSSGSPLPPKSLLTSLESIVFKIKRNNKGIVNEASAISANTSVNLYENGHLSIPSDTDQDNFPKGVALGIKLLGDLVLNVPPSPKLGGTLMVNNKKIIDTQTFSTSAFPSRYIAIGRDRSGYIYRSAEAKKSDIKIGSDFPATVIVGKLRIPDETVLIVPYQEWDRWSYLGGPLSKTEFTHAHFIVTPEKQLGQIGQGKMLGKGKSKRSGVE